MSLFAKKTSEKVNIFGYQLDNSNLNKIGNTRLSPLKSFAALFLVLAFILPQAVSRISDLSLYFTEFSAAKEIARPADVPAEDNDNFSQKAGREKIDRIKQEQEKAEQEKKEQELKLKNITLADIWPEESGAGKSAPNIIQTAQAPPEAGANQLQKQALVNIWPEEAKKRIMSVGRLVIPVIKVNANIGSLGNKQSGEMEAPKDPKEVGWFNFGPRPGEQGIALVAGHLDNAYGAPAVFWHLSKLKAGDDIFITDKNGKSIHFKVSGSKIYDANSPLEEIYGTGGAARLNLITCDGVWDKKTQNYSSRLVVSADLVAE